MTNRGNTIQTRLILLLVLVLVPVIVIQTYMYYTGFQERKAAQFRANLEIARAIAKSFDTFVSDVVRQELSIGLALASSPKLSREDPNRFLLRTKKDNPALWEIFWVSPTGIVLSATGSRFLGMNLSDRDYFKKIVAGQEYAISDLLLSRTTQQPSFTISRGIRDEKRVLLGIVTIGILPERLNQALGAERFTGGGFGVVDSKGMLVFRYPAIKASWEERNWLKQYPQFHDAFKGKEVSATVYAPFEGKNRMVSFAPIPSIGWATSAGQREEDLTGPVLASIRRNAIIIGLILTAAFFTALAFSRRIVKPLAELRQYALALGRGEGRQPLPVQSVPEFNDLAAAFNTMTENVRSRESALQESEERLRSVLDNTRDIIARFNLQANRYEYISPSTEALVGYSNDEFMAMDARQTLAMIHPEDLPALQTAQALSIETGEAEAEYRQRTRNGEYIWASNRMSVTRDESGQPLYCTFTLRDITERKHAEAALQKAHEELQERADKLEETNKELEGFAYTISHDLRAPLRAMNAYSVMLQEKLASVLDDDARRRLNAIETNAIKMGQLVDDLLAFSRAGRTAISISRIDMNKLVGEVLELLKVDGKDHLGVSVASLPPAHGDPVLIRQVLTNLLSNAVKFSGKRMEPCIEVGGSLEGGSSAYYVKDNGVGFDMRFYDQLFGVFHRLVTDEEFEGTGVGLAIVHRLVTRHGGRVWAEGEPDQGATFYFSLPGRG